MERADLATLALAPVSWQIVGGVGTAGGTDGGIGDDNCADAKGRPAVVVDCMMGGTTETDTGSGPSWKSVR